MITKIDWSKKAIEKRKNDRKEFLNEQHEWILKNLNQNKYTLCCDCFIQTLKAMAMHYDFLDFAKQFNAKKIGGYDPYENWAVVFGRLEIVFQWGPGPYGKDWHIINVYTVNPNFFINVYTVKF